MKKFVFFLTSLWVSVVAVFACDQTSVTVLSATFDGSEYTYTAQVCLGISPNWGATTGFELVADQSITGTSTSSITSTYNYCSVDIAFNGGGCAISSMGQPPAGGTIQSASVTASASTGGGTLSYSASGSPGWLAPDDLRGDCADCSNPNQLCWTIEFTTNSQISSLQLNDAEGSSTACPDEIDATIPGIVSCIPADLQAQVNGGSTVTVCQDEQIDLNSTCSSCVTGGPGSLRTTYSWSGPSGYSSTASDPGSFAATATSGGTYTLSGQTNGCPTQTTSVTVNVNTLPTGVLGVSSLDDCNSVTVPISFTGAGDWTFTYQIDGVDQGTITTSSNPYNLSVATTGVVTLNSTAGVTNTQCTGAGGVSGSTQVNISAVNSDAGSDFTPTGSTNYTIDATATAGNDGYDTVTTNVTASNSTSGTVNLGSTFDAGSIALSGISGNCPLDGNNLNSNTVCFNYTSKRAKNQWSADLCTDAGGTNCITVAVGDIPNTYNGSMATAGDYCFDYGDLLNLLYGEPCNTTLYLSVTDAGGSDAGTFNGWSTDFNDLALSIRPNPSYAWTALSGDANVSFLSSTTIEDPVFNAPEGTAAGCYQLTVTDGAGCTSTDAVCFDAIPLGLELMRFDAVVDNMSVVLSWEMQRFREDRKYFVQRSMDGVSFVDISEVVKPDETGAFEFVDNDPLSNGYYRIREVSHSDGTDYSATRFVSLVREETLEIMSLYPQPMTGNDLNLTVQSGIEQEAKVVLYSLQGQVVFEKEIYLEQGISTLQLNPKGTYSGMYSLELITERKKLFARVNRQ